MYPRAEYEMSEADLQAILDACTPTPVIMVGGYTPRSQQERANDAWAALGKKMGFDHMTVQPTSKGMRVFTAVPSETAEVRAARLAREDDEKRAAEISQLEDEIGDRQKRLAALRAKD